MTNITDAEDTELALFGTSITNTLNQFFIDFADSSLARWEMELGITVDESKDAAYRRSVIKSKIRGSGTITIALIKNVSESFSNGEVDVIEDNPNYSFTVKFVGTLGIPPNMTDLIASIEQIKPAHLAYTLEYTYRTHATLSAYTNAQLSAYTHQTLREGAM